jgi:hypothetical protein
MVLQFHLKKEVICSTVRQTFHRQSKQLIEGTSEAIHYSKHRYGRCTAVFRSPPRLIKNNLYRSPKKIIMS